MRSSRGRSRRLAALVGALALVAVVLLGALPPPARAILIITPDAPPEPKPSATATIGTTTAAPTKPPTATAAAATGDQRSAAPPGANGNGNAKTASPADAGEAAETTTTAAAATANPTPAATPTAAASDPKQPGGGRAGGSLEAPAARESDAETGNVAANERDAAGSSAAAPTSAPPPSPLSPPKTSTVEVVHERYVRGRGASGGEYFGDDDLDDRDLFASSSFEIEDSDADAGGAPGSGKRQNYASLDAGATILDSSPELKSPTNLLVPDKDRYMLMPCEKPRKWVVVSLSEDVHADAIAVANYEKFSSTVKEFIVLGSVNYPTDTWFVLGNFTAAQQNGEQIFPLDSQHHVRYIKLRFFSHYGSEYYCTLSQLKVYGRTFTQVISQLEKSIDAEGALEIAALPPPAANMASLNSDGSKEGGEAGSSFGDHGIHDEQSSVSAVSSHQCPTEEVIISVFTAAITTGPTCSILDAPKQSPVKIPPFLPQPARSDYQPETELTSRELAALEALGRHVEPQHVTGQTSATSNGSTNAATTTTRSNGSASAVAPTSTVTTGLHAQGLGRLESIFVRITKKIQQLEFNQSLFARQLEETQAQQKALTTSLHAKQDALVAQMQDIRTILSDMRARMDRESVSNDQYHRIVDELRKENLALWNEMLVVREVITTMKAAILCALGLSACIIVFYLLRLLLRCIQSAKRRADLREWFWRMESMTQQQNEDADVNAPEPTINEPVGSWRVNYKKQFGSSWDDLAIERKTLLRDLVDEEASSLQTVHGGHRNKRMRTASLVNPPKLTDLMVQMELAHLAAEVGASSIESDIAVKEEIGASQSDTNPYQAMERGMVRRPSTTESTASSGCDVTFDDFDDSHVFAYLDEGDEHGSMKPAPSRTVEFRLDFSSRVNPAPPAASPSSSPVMSRRSSTSSLGTASKQPAPSSTAGRVLQRSPSVRSTTIPFRKRLSRRPSEPVPDAAVAAAIAKVSSVRPESPPSSPTSYSPPRANLSIPASVGPSIAAPKSSVSPILKPSTPGTDEMLMSAQSAAMAAAASEIDKLQIENGSLRESLVAARFSAAELQERVHLAEQQNESLSDQLIAVQEAYEAKLQSAFDMASAEREEQQRQKESELQALRERSDQERETLERDMKAAVAKIESDLQSDADQLQRLLRDGKDQTNALKTQIATLQAELKVMHAEKQQLRQADASLATKCDSLQRSSDHWEGECQRLQEQVNQLLHDQENERRREHTEKHEAERNQALQKATQERLVQQVQLLQSQLKALAVGARELIKAEVKKTTQLFTRVQQQASELAIKHNEKAMALVAKQNRIIQLETQLKNERQSVMQLDASLAKTTRAMQRKDECFRSKYQEQKEFLDITVAVRNGLTNELQNKKKKLEEMESQLREVLRTKEAVERKNKHLVQQVKIMQHVHTREMEQVALSRQQQQQQSGTRRRSSIGSCSSFAGAPTQQRQWSKGAAIATSTNARNAEESCTLSSRTSEPLTTTATGSTSIGASESTEIPAMDQDTNTCADRDGTRRRRWLPEDDEFAAEEWREFVKLAALHEAECRYQLQQQQSKQPQPHHAS